MRPPLPKGSNPLSPEICARRADVFARLTDHYNANSAPAGMAGTGADDRFAIYAYAGPAAIGGEPPREVARCSSLKRAEIVAQTYLERGWRVDCAFDLDTLDGELPPLEVGDEVIDIDGELRTIEDIVTESEEDSRRKLIVSTSDGLAEIYEDETDEDGGVRRNAPESRWPVRHQ